MGEDLGSSSRAIESSNIGYKLLQKCGWKEGTGLGVSEQGQLEPVQTHVKNNKRGLGAEKIKKNKRKVLEDNTSNVRESRDDYEQVKAKKKNKIISKRMRKMQEEKQIQEKEFERAFFREFWPDNV